MDIRQEFGSKLKLMRSKAGYTRTEFSKKSGISRQYIRELEDNKNTKRVTILTLAKLAKALKVPAWRLLKFD